MTPAVQLRPFKDRDFGLLVSLRNDPELQVKLQFPVHPQSNGNVLKWIERRSLDPTGAFLVIAIVRSDEPIGFVQLYNIEFLSESGEISICIAPKFQGRGFGSRALKLLHLYAKHNFHLKRLTLRVISSNHEAISLYQKAGYQPFGILMEVALPADETVPCETHQCIDQ